MGVIQLLVAENNKQYNQYLNTIDNDDICSLLPYVTVEAMYMFLAIIIQIDHDVKDTLKSN